MKKAGGIVALIAGLFGTGAAVVTLLLGGIGGAVEAEGAETIIGLGWAGLGFAFLTIVLAAVALGSNRKAPGYLLIASAVGGAILGGTLVAICMGLAFVGGILVVVDQRRRPAPTTALGD